MLSHPNCKINLGLHIIERMPNGYHNLQTIFVPVPLTDDLEIIPASHFSFIQEGITLDNDPDDNLCVKAYRLLKDRYPQVGNVTMRLNKKIPFGAGLGGGSSDAAFCLTMLNHLFQLHLTNTQLEHYASLIGADCPFFVRNQAAYATGIGDQLQPIDFNLESYRLVLLKPTDAVSTKEAYAGIIPNNNHRPDLREVILSPIKQWRQLIVNDFEKTVFPLHPRIAFLKDYLYQKGALYVSMSGSGATVFGLFSPQNTTTFNDIPAYEQLLV